MLNASPNVYTLCTFIVASCLAGNDEIPRSVKLILIQPYCVCQAYNLFEPGNE